MSIKTRRILYISFILAFLIITPIVMSYAAGYKFSFAKKSFQKTGMIIIESEPIGAKIYLNDKPQKTFLKRYFGEENSYIITPAKLKNITPGEYSIKLELAGYWSWEKKLVVRGGETTFAEDINLFKKDAPLLISEGNYIFSSSSPDEKKYILNNGEKTILLDLEKEEENVLPFQKIEKEIVWSSDGKMIIINETIFDLENRKELINLKNYIGREAINIKWKDKDNNTILFQSEKEKSIKIFSLATKDVKTITKEIAAKNFILKNNYLYTIEEKKGITSLNSFNINSGEARRSINIPSFGLYNFVNQDNKFINLYDEKHQILYIINPDDYFPVIETINNVKNSEWINDDTLLYINDFEIWLADIKNYNKELLTRISGRISQAIWHPSQNYIIYLTSGSINAIELDNREKHNITELIKTDMPSAATINKDGDILYFNGKIGSQQGVYKLTIQ